MARGWEGKSVEQQQEEPIGATQWCRSRCVTRASRLQNGVLTLSKKRTAPLLRQAAVTSLLGTQGRFHNVRTDLRIINVPQDLRTVASPIALV